MPYCAYSQAISARDSLTLRGASVVAATTRERIVHPLDVPCIFGYITNKP